MKVAILALAACSLIAFAMPARAATDSATYKYDTLGRLTEIDYVGGTIVKYAYDAAGNRTSVTVTCGTGGC